MGARERLLDVEFVQPVGLPWCTGRQCPPPASLPSSQLSALALVSLNIMLLFAILGLSMVLLLPGLSGQAKTGSVWLTVSSPAEPPPRSRALGSSSLGTGSCSEFRLLLSVGLQCHSKPDTANKRVKKKMFILRTGTVVNTWNLSRVCLL